MPVPIIDRKLQVFFLIFFFFDLLPEALLDFCWMLQGVWPELPEGCGFTDVSSAEGLFRTLDVLSV